MHVVPHRPQRVSPVPGAAPPGHRRARHLVLLRALAVLHARVARVHAGAEGVLPDLGAVHRLRHPVLLGRADGDARHQVHGRRAVPPRLHPRPDPRRRGPEDVQVQGERGRSPERDGQVRHRRLPLHAGRARRPGARHPARRGADRGLPELRQQDLERGAPGADEPRGLRSRARPARHAVGGRPLDQEPPHRGDRPGAQGDRHLSLQRRRLRGLPVPLARVLRLVPRDRQAEPLPAGEPGGEGGHPAHAGGDARDHAAAAPSVHAVHLGRALAAPAAQGRVNNDRALPQGHPQGARSRRRSG